MRARLQRGRVLPLLKGPATNAGCPIQAPFLGLSGIVALDLRLPDGHSPPFKPPSSHLLNRRKSTYRKRNQGTNRAASAYP
jgi:hypothetical protein